MKKRSHNINEMRSFLLLWFAQMISGLGSAMTAYTVYESPDALQQPAGRVGNPMDIANMVLFLASDKAGFITSENFCIDGGQTKLMIYQGAHGWTLMP